MSLAAPSLVLLSSAVSTGKTQPLAMQKPIESRGSKEHVSNSLDESLTVPREEGFEAIAESPREGEQAN